MMLVLQLYNLMANNHFKTQISSPEKNNSSRVRNIIMPSSSVNIWLKLHQQQKFLYSSSNDANESRKIPKSQEERDNITKNGQTIVLSPNIVLHKQRPNLLSFHHYKKFNSYDFQFSSIIDTNTHNLAISQRIDLYEELLENKRDICLMAIGGLESGLLELSEGVGGQQGIFYLLLSKLVDRISVIKQKNMEEVTENEHIANVKLLLKFLVVFDDKLYDLTNPKNTVSLKENGIRGAVVGCNIYEPSSVYDLFTKMKQIISTSRLVYPQSILIIEGELQYNKISVDPQEMGQCSRYFALIQWEKSLKNSENNRKNHNNNQTLLTLNMCIYQLYKFSYHNVENVTEGELNKLWAMFRSSNVTKYLKNYLVKQRRLLVIGCVSISQLQEEDSYQTLMICKNIGKIKFAHSNHQQYQQEKATKPIRSRIKNQPNLDSKKEGSSSLVSKMSLQHSIVLDKNGSDLINLSKVKSQLKKILEEKKSQQDKQEQKTVIHLLKLQNKKKKQLGIIRFKKEQMRVGEQYCKHQDSYKEEQLILPVLSRKSAQKSKYQSVGQKELSKLNLEEETKLKQLKDIHGVVLEKINRKKNMQLNKRALQMEIKMNQSEILQFVDHKQKIITMLKNQVRDIKQEQRKSIPFKNNSKRDFYKKSRLKHNEGKSEPITEAVIYDSVSLSRYVVDNSLQKAQTIEVEDYKTLKPLKGNKVKSVNRQDYLFQKRRAQLKQKLKKGREDINNFYEDAAEKFQMYSRIRQKTQ